MTNAEARKLIKENTKKVLGAKFNEEVYKRAEAKAKRWIKAAYGSSADWISWMDENADENSDICCYMEESKEKAKPSDRTINRQVIR